jgi:hypothetical protein
MTSPYNPTPSGSAPIVAPSGQYAVAIWAAAILDKSVTWLV